MENTIARTAALMVLITLASAFAMIGASHDSSRRAAKATFELGRW